MTEGSLTELGFQRWHPLTQWYIILERIVIGIVFGAYGYG